MEGPLGHFAIRDREQQLIDYYGSAKGDLKNRKPWATSGNDRRGVAKEEILG